MRHLLILLSLMLATAPVLAEDSAYLDKVSEADKAAADGRWADAEALTIEALRMEPGNPGNILLMSNLGLLRFYMGKDSLALDVLADAHRMAPASVTILKNRARVYEANGRFQEARADYDEILRLDSLERDARFHRGILALNFSDMKTATADFEFMKRHWPEDVNTNLGNAMLETASGRYEEAIVYYNRVLQEDKNPVYYGERAFCRIQLGQLQDASDDIAAAIELDPEYGELYLYRAVLNRMRYRPEDAEADLRHAAELGVDISRVDFITSNKKK